MDSLTEEMDQLLSSHTVFKGRLDGVEKIVKLKLMGDFWWFSCFPLSAFSIAETVTETEVVDGICHQRVEVGIDTSCVSITSRLVQHLNIATEKQVMEMDKLEKPQIQLPGFNAGLAMKR